MNFALWHEEDVARRDDLPSERVRDAKRAIDRFNQARNDAVEQIDLQLIQRIEMRSPQSGILHSETPGMMMDRLSIIALKEYHMQIEANRLSASSEHRNQCAGRVRILQEQRADLVGCLDQLLLELGQGRRRFKLYRQFKMYNDPSLNPEIYQTKGANGGTNQDPPSHKSP
jgi:hypothetical protein